jgi:membrane-associated phospholipid phosphatase
VLVVAALGLVVLGASIAGARRPTIPVAEQRVFRAVNGWPGGLYPVLWLPMQLGNLVVGTVVGVVVVSFQRDWWAIVAVLVAMVLKLVTERVIRRQFAAALAVRRRPGTSMPGAVLRGDVPADGPSFPSGHVLLVAAIAGVVAGAGPWWVAAIAYALAVTVAVGRVYVGAHNPLDVTAGLGAGLLIGGILGATL